MSRFRYDLFYSSYNIAIPSSVLVGIITFNCVANHLKTRPLSPTNAGLLDDTKSEVNGMETYRQESIGRRVSVTGEGVERLNNLEHHVSEETNVRQRPTHLSANMLLPLQSHSGSLMLVIDGEHIRIELISHDYIHSFQSGNILRM
ncbi:hypothetical protein DPMN_056560 [Dreissena polymorpha]|uniref:Uncharacterized protein n=1 Tax=Dreissena polymorpha TaxID=45954 RepID=A0A9D4HTQ3_DREPO|nr:hypothetical protein DPMN_056560 [Dreissena polymorpha]